MTRRIEAAACRIGAQPPGPAEVRGDMAYVLRVTAHLDWPDEGTPRHRRLHRLMPQSPSEGAAHDDHLLIECRLLGTYAPSAPGDAHAGRIVFSGDPGQLDHPDRYDAFIPTRRMRDLFVNGTVDQRHRIRFGQLRDSETPSPSKEPGITACLSMLDIRGKRSAMFGKTRLGKSNVVKLLVQGMLDVTAQSRDVGQLIFDVNGEYANSNPQDGADNIGAAYADRCTVYFLSDRSTSDANAKLLRFNFYERPEDAMNTLRELLPMEVADTDYVRPLLTCRLPPLQPVDGDTVDVLQRRLRKLMIYWTILHTAGFDHCEARLSEMLNRLGYGTQFNPNFSQPLRMAAYQAINGTTAPPLPKTFAEMEAEVSLILRFSLSYPNDPALRRQGRYIFDADEEIMAAFLFPQAGAGPYVLRPAVPFHSPQVDNFITEILASIDTGGTVIVDLGSANERIIRYFARTLSVAVFLQQEGKFVRNEMQGRYVQIYFEEAHMIFPPNSGNVIDVYSRFAKEGAKFNIGIVYSTQSPSTVNQDLLAQTENFFIGHLSSERETQLLSAVQYAFKGMENDIMRSRSPGYMRVLTASHRYPIPIQANRYDGQPTLVTPGTPLE
ncbi:helicase HerA domain-containing protein [Roseateles amylovorans]|uniref:DUF87 domain-containing protein n=1 Tax=Roseateles amylovorans TaxID=2978473 RepID=A0ABY6B9K9_9BURK|nr:DUF87 domain-containing protein [Roseateles amylovorans]UXH80270.1 DUF87 domain-containing protein [Roseateles amylovorans]